MLDAQNSTLRLQGSELERDKQIQKNRSRFTECTRQQLEKNGNNVEHNDDKKKRITVNRSRFTDCKRQQ